MKSSQELLAFYKWWSEKDADTCFSKRSFGLCTNTSVYTMEKFPEGDVNEEAKEERYMYRQLLLNELAQQFTRSGLNHHHPFHERFKFYEEENNRGEAHLNENRSNWVEARIYDMEGKK